MRALAVRNNESVLISRMCGCGSSDGAIMTILMNADVGGGCWWC